MQYFTIVTYHPNKGQSVADLEALYQAVVPKFARVRGLVRKYFGYDEASNTGTSVYLWDSREQAETFFAKPAFVASFREAFGCDIASVHYVPVRAISEHEPRAGDE
ncbi:MAG: YdhR family protein [Neisseriaceae bacterium]|nr:YdhR family protein [Neisseriaceae bacterium]MBP6861688.1 YdhR family protein [Neisseriaceae bacterium]